MSEEEFEKELMFSFFCKNIRIEDARRTRMEEMTHQEIKNEAEVFLKNNFVFVCKNWDRLLLSTKMRVFEIMQKEFVDAAIKRG